MKYIFTLLALFVCLGANAAQAPFPPWLDIAGQYVAPDGTHPYVLSAGETVGIYPARVARFEYDVAVHGSPVAEHGLSVQLPAKAVLVRSYFKIITQFVDSGSGTIALSCEDANNVKTATDITGSSANAFVEGASTGAASAFQRAIASPCEITATVGGVAPSAGKLVGWVHYVIED